MTYGLAMLAYEPLAELKDERTHQISNAIYIGILVCAAVVLAAFTCFIRFRINRANN